MPAAGPAESVKLEFLRRVGADRVTHTRLSLLDHLVATRDVVASWGAPTVLQDAALFHSVYGTEELAPRISEPLVCEAERDRVRALIGVEAERLAWLFGRIDLVAFVDWASRGGRGPAPVRDGGPAAPLSAEEAGAVANLIVANALEQLPRRHRGHRRRTRALFRMKAHLHPEAISALKRERSWRRRLLGARDTTSASGRA